MTAPLEPTARPPRLLAPTQVVDARRLHAIGVFDEATIARMIGATLEQALLSFRVVG